MTDLTRQEITTSAKLVVIKVGTRVLTKPDGTLDQQQISRLADDIHQLMSDDYQVVLVSSGAVGAGVSQLGLSQRPANLAQLQAVAAIGQAKLIETYDRYFGQHGRHAAQVLLTAEDLQDRGRYLNVRNTLLSLLDMGAVPIINENDTVAVDELMLTFGDNDRLAALVTNLIGASLLIILSDVAGLFDGDPANANSTIIPTVAKFDEQLQSYIQVHASAVSKGGMASKVEAARVVTMAGESVILASGHEANVLSQIMDGQTVGTLFLPHGKSISPWKRWIGFSVQPRGKVLLDNGAQSAVVENGSSLLAIGITQVEGKFDKGDVLSICSAAGQEFARGLTNYSSEELLKIHGLKSNAIADRLGHCPYKQVIHRDNMALTNAKP